MFHGGSTGRSSTSHDRGRTGVTGSLHQSFSRQPPSCDPTCTLGKRCQRFYSTSPPASNPAIAKKQRTESPDHGLMHAHGDGWIASRVGRGTPDCESSNSDSGYSSHPAQLPGWDPDSDSHGHRMFEPSRAISDSPSTSYTAQFSQLTHPSTCSSRDCDNAGTRSSSPHGAVGPEHRQSDSRLFEDTDLLHVGVGLPIENCLDNQEESSGDPIAYQDTNSNRPTSTTSVDHVSKRVNVQSPKPTSPSDRTDASSDSTESESKSSQSQIMDENGGSTNDLQKLCADAFDLAVAQEVYARIKGKLCFAPQEKVHESSLGLGKLTLLDCFHLGLKGAVVPNTIASSDSGEGSSESSSQFTAGQGTSSSGSSSSRRGASRRVGAPDASNNQATRDGSGPTTGTRGNRRGAPSKRLRELRCPFNAFLPEYYCATLKTEPPGKYARCAGPGYTIMQHLKEHVVNTHVSGKVTRCGRCQATFATKKLLKDHDDNVECKLRCAECNQEFESKSDRNAHNNEKHTKSSLEEMEFDRDQYDEINSLIKQYNPPMGGKKGKQNEHGADPKLEEWVSKNMGDFMVGRKDNVNARQQLGQWYIMFTRFFPEAPIPLHPFYDLEVVTLRGDEIEEKCLLIFRTARTAWRKRHGPIPADPDRADQIYDALLRGTFKVAGNTSLLSEVKGNLHGASQEDLTELCARDIEEPAMDGSRVPGYQPHQFQAEGDVLQSHVHNAGPNQQDIGVYAPTQHEGSLQHYGTTLPINPSNDFGFSPVALQGNYTAPGGPYGQQYVTTATSDFYSAPIPYEAYPDALAGATFQAPGAQTSNFQLSGTQLAANTYQNQIQSEQQQPQPAPNQQHRHRSNRHRGAGGAIRPNQQ